MTKRRYEGVLHPHTSAHWPNRVLCVDAVECETAEWSDEHGHEPDLLYWRAIPLVSEHGRYQYCAMWHGDTDEQWWNRVRGLCERGNTLTILCARAQTVWPQLGIWRALQSGLLQMVPDGYDYSDPVSWAISHLRTGSDDGAKVYSSGRINDYIDRHTGYMCLSASPTIARLKLRGTDCWLTLVDVGNYGISPPADAPHGDRVAQWIAQWYTRYHAVCAAYRLGAWKPTVGGQAYEGWRYGYYNGGAIVCGEQSTSAIETHAYIGGRCEAYRIGPIVGMVTYLDIRAAYCSICQTERVPVRVVYVGEGDESASKVDRLGWRDCAARVRVRTDLPIYPYSRDGLTVWPTGEFDTTLCGAELEIAVERGDIVAWHTVVHYHCDTVLSEYSRAVYGLRCVTEAQRDSELTTVAKLLCNTIVGAMARRQKDWIPCARDGCDVQWGEWYGADEIGNLQRYRSLGGQVQKEVDNGYVAGAMPAMAAWITAACRVQLWNYIQIAGVGQTYYVDTDALMLSDLGVQRLGDAGCIAEGAIGRLGTRWNSCDVVLHGIKHYRHDGHVVCAGLPAGGADDTGDGDSFYCRLSPNDQVRAKTAPTGRVILRHYRHDAEYRHGVVQHDGSVTPIVIGDT
jgi:hypothetical protein